MATRHRIFIIFGVNSSLSSTSFKYGPAFPPIFSIYLTLWVPKAYLYTEAAPASTKGRGPSGAKGGVAYDTLDTRVTV